MATKETEQVWDEKSGWNFCPNCGADLEKFPKWIPVTERLPEPNAVDEYGFAKGYLVKTDRHVMMHTARYTGEWWIFWGKAEVITDTVTHWMPLPQAPKEG